LIVNFEEDSNPIGKSVMIVLKTYWRVPQGKNNQFYILWEWDPVCSRKPLVK